MHGWRLRTRVALVALREDEHRDTAGRRRKSGAASVHIGLGGTSMSRANAFAVRRARCTVAARLRPTSPSAVSMPVTSSVCLNRPGNGRLIAAINAHRDEDLTDRIIYLEAIAR